jgi:hypothetical protein
MGKIENKREKLRHVLNKHTKKARNKQRSKDESLR